MSELDDMPVRADWGELRERFVTAVQREFTAYMSTDQPNFDSQLTFAAGRFDEGTGWLRHFCRFAPFVFDRRLNVLDIGAGNGGVAFAFANVRNSEVHTLDLVPNLNLRVVRGSVAVPIHSSIGDGAELPYRSGAFDIVLLLDTIEHVARPRELASEVMRVLRAGGVCVITTPARLRHIFGRDPHYGVPGLVALPNGLQRFIVNDVLKRRVHGVLGHPSPAYDVTHLYWNVREIAGLFPQPHTVEVLHNRQYRPPGKFTREWLRHPSVALEQLRFNVREYFFDRILIWKKAA